MRILHFGDLHTWKLGLARDFWYPKRILGTVNLVLRRRARFPSRYLAPVVETIASREADLVIFSGDLTTMSLESEFAEAARLLEPIREKWGDRFFCIPGNHDRYTPTSIRDGLYERYFPYGAFAPGSLVRSQVLRDDLSVVGFDCSHPCKVRSNGTISSALEAELRAALQAEQRAGRKVLLTGHYPLAYPAEVHASWEHKLLKADRLRRLATEFEPIAYFHGHKHQRWLERDRAAPKTLCINCGSAGMSSSDPDKQAGFLTMELDGYAIREVIAHVLDDDSLEFSTLPLAERETASPR